jgi:hypothetical protein
MIDMCMRTQKVIPKKRCYICERSICIDNKRGLCDACAIKEEYDDRLNQEERSWQKKD